MILHMYFFQMFFKTLYIVNIPAAQKKEKGWDILPCKKEEAITAHIGNDYPTIFICFQIYQRLNPCGNVKKYPLLFE